ncbi:MAG: cytochrome P450 [Bradyrhizobium sp.]|nr:cytochrome P450 [Bradyrhizobium sp.]
MSPPRESVAPLTKPAPLSVTLRINGERRTLSVAPWTTLLDLLRNHLDLTGTKKGCDHGQCGACTVLIDGRRVLSCLALAVMKDGAEITTIEGLAKGDELHPLQQAFIDHDAFQCGYCTPGQICSAAGLIAEGRAWKHQRRTLAPAFTPRAVAGLIPHMIAVTDDTVTRLKQQCDAPVDLREIMQRMTLDIAGRTMFSFEMGRHGATLRDFVFEYGARLASPHLLDIVLPLSWPTPRDIARRRFRKRWTAFVTLLMAERRAAGKLDDAPPRDLFDLMGAARDPETGAAFTDAQLADEVATMILAGHETTATALFWALYLIALDPASQSKLAQEAGAASDLGDPDRLPFTRAVIDETLRLYPPAFLIARAASGPDRLADFPVKRGDVVLISPWLLHRHEKLWRAPNAFMPERFLPGAAPPERFAYLPFGAGARVCIGAHFALVEAVLALARLVGAFKIELIDRAPVMPIGVVTTQPDRSPLFRITPR